MSYVEEIKKRGRLVIVGTFCSWYSYNGFEYIIYNSDKYIECENGKEADLYYSQAEGE